MYEKTTKDITPTESLTFLENQLAYGVTVKQRDSNSYEIVLAGYKKISFWYRTNEEGSESEEDVAPSREFTIHLDGDYYEVSGIYVHQSVGFFTSGVDGISIIYTDKENLLQAKYLANHET